MKKKPEAEQVEFLTSLVRQNVLGIVEHEGEVRIEKDVTPARVVFSVFVAPTDIGLILGDGGATADAIRRIVWTACKKTRYRVDIDIVTDRPAPRRVNGS